MKNKQTVMKNLKTATAALLLSACGVFAADDSAAKLEQFPLQPISASYSVSGKDALAQAFAKLSGYGASCTYELSKNEDGTWLLKENFGGMKWETIIDAKANLLTEKATLLQKTKKESSASKEKASDSKDEELADAPRDSEASEEAEDEDCELDKKSAKKKKSGGIFSFFGRDSKKSEKKSEKKKTEEKPRLESVSVAIEDDSIFGECKTVSLKWDNGKTRESLISADSIVTSFLHIAVWVGTLKDLPQNGQEIRWLFDGDPFPMMIRRERGENGDFYVVTRGESISTEKNKDQHVFKFFFENAKNGLSMPDRIEFSSSPEVTLIFEKQK